jgi:hypothetical protein
MKRRSGMILTLSIPTLRLRKGDQPMSLTKLLLASAVALTTLGAGAAQAQYYSPPPPPGYYHHHHHWHPGDRYYGPRHPIYHWERYHLPPPPPGAYWVNDGGQFVLVGGGGSVIRLFIP